jgi:hypothetical protein
VKKDKVQVTNVYHFDLSCVPRYLTKEAPVPVADIQRILACYVFTINLFCTFSTGFLNQYGVTIPIEVLKDF